MSRYSNPMFEENKARHAMDEKKREALHPSDSAPEPVSKKWRGALILIGITAFVLALVGKYSFGDSSANGRLLSFVIGSLFLLSSLCLIGLYYTFRAWLYRKKNNL